MKIRDFTAHCNFATVTLPQLENAGLETSLQMAEQPPSKPEPYGNLSQEIQKAQQPVARGMDSVVNTLNTIGRRLRILEDRYANLRRKTQLTDQNMLSNSKRMNTEIRNITDDIKDAKKEIYDMKEKLSLFVKELDTCARSEDMKIIENYVNLWSPIQFVTQTEAKNLIKRILSDVTENYEQNSEEDGQQETVYHSKQSETFNNSTGQSSNIKRGGEE